MFRFFFRCKEQPSGACWPRCIASRPSESQRNELPPTSSNSPSVIVLRALESLLCLLSETIDDCSRPLPRPAEPEYIRRLAATGASQAAGDSGRQRSAGHQPNGLQGSRRPKKDAAG
ncbi:hypothetical protein V8C43DRAFT_51585 [Trichoderma afarasin]